MAVNWPLTSAIAAKFALGELTSQVGLLVPAKAAGEEVAGAEVGSIEPSGHEPGPIPLTSIIEISRASSPEAGPIADGTEKVVPKAETQPAPADPGQSGQPA